jgi:hypothetical protein
MDATALTLRVTASGREPSRVSIRRHQFVVGRPIEFDADAPTVSALEYALGALGAEVVGGLRAFAKRRRLVLDEVEALVRGEVEHALVYLEVVGETGPPHVAAVVVNVFVSTPEDPETVHRAFADALARLPLLGTFRRALRVDVDLTLT